MAEATAEGEEMAEGKAMAAVAAEDRVMAAAGARATVAVEVKEMAAVGATAAARVATERGTCSSIPHQQLYILEGCIRQSSRSRSCVHTIRGTQHPGFQSASGIYSR